MINHPEQRKIRTLDSEEYKDTLRAKMKGLRLEFAIYRERDDMESCQEIRAEFLTIMQELLSFDLAEKLSDKYHGVR
tara:strand:+ start:2897 stop:3127 length:231 start_codon:yes stop_codon:yes gene_type:complete